jgi:hypothetical protein
MAGVEQKISESDVLHLKPPHADDWMLAIGVGLLTALAISAASLRRRQPALRHA